MVRNCFLSAKSWLGSFYICTRSRAQGADGANKFPPNTNIKYNERLGEEFMLSWKFYEPEACCESNLCVFSNSETVMSRWLALTTVV